MINRTMVRTRVVQTLFAFYEDGDKTVTSARKELTKSFADTYDLYFVLLDFVNELTAYAQQQLEEQILPDGAHYEQSPMYHCILLDRLLDAINIGERYA